MPGGSGIELVFDAHLRAHASLARGLDAIEGFMRSPGVSSVAPVSEWDRKAATFRYETRAEISLAEILDDAEERPSGTRAAVELMVQIAGALDAVRGPAEDAGLYSHGCLNPWRIAIDSEGQVVLLGFGIPDVELFAYLDGQESGVSVDTLRYAPPERLDDQEEDARSDLYTLAVIGAEMMLGRPVFDGPPEKVAERVINGDAPELIEALGDHLGEEALDLLCVATERKPEHRFRTIAEFLGQARALAKKAKGRSLAEVVQQAIEVRAARLEDEDLPTEVAPLPDEAPTQRAAPEGLSAPPPDDPSISVEPTEVHRPLGQADAEPTEVAPLPGRAPTRPAMREDEEDEEDAEDELGVDDLPTESGLESDFELVAEVAALPADATLEDVQEHARAIVSRARQLAEQAEAMEVIAVQRAHNMDGVGPVVRKLKEAVGKAQKAASSTANTAKLVELDDTLTDALMTLDMVRSAERLCYSATDQALEILYRVQAEVDQARAQEQTLERARRQSTEAANRARDAARDATQIVKALEATRYSVDIARDLLRRARKSASQATAAAVRAKQGAQSVQTRTRAPEAERESERARSAADDAKSALEAIRSIQQTLDEAESDARDVLASRLRSCVARARSAALSARQSLERAENAATHATIPQGSALLQAMERHVTAAERAADQCESIANPVLESAREGEAGSPAIRRALTDAEAAAGLAEAQSTECGARSDKLVALAGEAAAAEAELAKWKSEARAILGRVDDRASEVLGNWVALSEDAEEVTARTALDAIQVAARAAGALEEHVETLRSEVAAVEAAVDVDGLDERVAAIGAMETEFGGLADKAAARCREARAAASRELAEIARRREQRAALQKAITLAREHADRCLAAVKAAWSAYQETVDVLSTANIDGADKLRARAYEIIDIAEFQAGEAETAAEAAAAQSDPDEARSHASTAESFEQRITEDLPEAIELLDKARTRATEEIERLTEAKERVESALNDGREAVRVIEELRQHGRDTGSDWSDLAVNMALDQLESLASGLDEDLAEVRYAAERTRQVEAADDAWEMVPVAEAASKRLVEVRAEAESIARTLDAAVKTARQEAETRENAIEGVTHSLTQIEKMRAAITERAQTLRAAVATHQAVTEDVQQATSRMTEAVDGTADAESLVRRALLEVREASTASEARNLQQQSEQALEAVTQHLEAAAEAQTQGVAAAEREAVEREDAERRQLDQARSTALTHVKTAKLAAEKGVALLREANEELAGTDDPEVRRLHERATEWVRVARTNATSALKAARECQRAKVAVTAVEWEQRANGLATDASNAVAEAGSILREAVDIKRRAVQEAEALEDVKSEIQSILTAVAENVKQAEADAARVKDVTSGSRDPITLAHNDEADTAATAVKRAAAKVEAAAPMALTADHLDVAQNLLETCRAAQQRTEEAAEAVRDLIQKAQQALGEEEERAAQRLADARSEAERPAQEAAAVAQKAEDWLGIGRETATSAAPAVQKALEELKTAVEETQRLAEQAENAAQPARRAPNVRTATAIGEQVKAAAERTERASERAKAALEGVRQAVKEAEAEEAKAQEFRLQAAEDAAAAELAASEATAAAEALEKELSESGVVHDDAARAFREVKRTAKAVAAAAAAAFETTEKSVAMTALADVQGAASAVADKKTVAETLLAELQEHVEKCRSVITEIQQKAREEEKRKKDEKLRAKLRKRRNESKIMKREELKARFQEREERPQPNLSSLRERLRARRRRKDGEEDDGPRRIERPTPVRPETGATPRRRSADRGPRRRRRRPPPDESSRLVPPDEAASEPMQQIPVRRDEDSGARRSREERQRSREQRRQRRRRRRDAPSERPAAAPPRDAPTNMGLIDPSSDNQPGSEGADALLRRLRKKRRDEDE